MPEYKIGDNIVFDCGERPFIGTVHPDSFTERYPYLMVDDGTGKARLSVLVYHPDTIDEIENDAGKEVLERHAEYNAALHTALTDCQGIETCMVNVEKAITAYRYAAKWLNMVVEAARLLKEI